MRHHLFRRLINLTFAFLLAVFSVNLSGVLTIANAFATSGEPTFADLCETANDTYSIPAASGDIKYYTVNGSATQIKTGVTNQTASGTVTITAHKNNGDPTNTTGNPWSHTFTNVACTTPSTSPSPSPSTSPNGNNGTLKVHEFGTPLKTTNEDPKVCVFNLEGFKFDVGQTGYIVISDETASNGANSLSSAIPFGPTANVGQAQLDAYAETADYVNAAGSPYTLANGQYKATLYGKDAGNNIDLTNEKAKSKVFKVECPTATTVAPTVKQDLCGTANDKYTIPSVTGIDYYVNNVLTPAGDYNTNGALSVTITAKAQAGYVLSGTASWTKTFTNDACPIEATPAVPEFVDECQKGNDAYTIHATPGVIYKVNNVEKSANTYTPGNSAYTTGITITAHATAGYVLAANATASWYKKFTNANCPATPAEPKVAIDECGVLSDTFTITAAEGVSYQVKVGQIGQTEIWAPISAGTHTTLGAATIKIKAVAKNGYFLNGQTSTWTLNFNTAKCPVTASVTPHEVCGAGDSFTITPADHVTYKKAVQKYWVIIPGVLVIPYTDYEVISDIDNNATGSVTIKAFADAGYEIDGQDTWTFNFNSNKCETAFPVEGDPVFTDLCGTVNDAYTIEPAQGVVYEVNGTPALPGLYTNASGAIEIVALASDPNFTLTGTTTWTHTFDNTACPVEPCTPTMVPLAMLDNLQHNDNCEPGRGNAGGTTTTSNDPTVMQLPQTGAEFNPLRSLLTVIIAGVLTYGATYFLVNRRDLAQK